MVDSLTLPALHELAERQLGLLNLVLYLISKGPAEFQGVEIACSLPQSKAKATALLAMGAGQSVKTLLNISHWRGIPVRDMYPIARSSVESFVNAAFVAVENESVAKRACDYIPYAAWKNMNRRVGSGRFSLEISVGPSSSDDREAEFSEFIGKGNGTWTKLDTPSRIRRVGELGGSRAGARLLASYALIYGLSSEIIHGSPFGVSYFFSAHSDSGLSLDAFERATEKQVEDIFVAVLHAVAGFLCAFFSTNELAGPAAAEQAMFDRLLEMNGADPQGVAGD
jgi:hypothetical protein